MSIEFLHLSRQKSEVGVADVGVVLNEEVREDVQRNDFLIDFISLTNKNIVKTFLILKDWYQIHKIISNSVDNFYFMIIIIIRYIFYSDRMSHIVRMDYNKHHMIWDDIKDFLDCFLLLLPHLHISTIGCPVIATKVWLMLPFRDFTYYLWVNFLLH